MFPDFVQHHSLKKHLNFTASRFHDGDGGDENFLYFPAFVETLSRICFCSLAVGSFGSPSPPASLRRTLAQFCLLFMDPCRYCK